MRVFAHSTIVNKCELWEMFAKTGDIEWYDMYCSMKEYEENSIRQRRDNANSRYKS